MAQFRERLIQLRDEIEAIEPNVEAARGFAGQSAYIDLQTAKFFEEYITWELDHPTAISGALIHNEIFPGKLGGKPVDDAAAISARISGERFAFHIDHELTGAMALLARAKSTSAGDFDGPGVPQPDWTRLVFEDGYFRIGGLFST